MTEEKIEMVLDFAESGIYNTYRAFSTPDKLNSALEALKEVKEFNKKAILVARVLGGE